jgi:GGDEF domain-containing protein
MNPRSAERLARAARAAQALSETLWEALHEELTDPAQRRVAELSERLADVSATVALLVRSDPGVSSPGERSAAPTQPRSAFARAINDGPPAVGEFSAEPESGLPAGRAIESESPAPRESSAEREHASPAVLVDELAPDAPLAQTPSTPPESWTRAPQEIEIRDERHDELHHESGHDEGDQGAWVGAIERRLERYERDRAPFAVLVAELVDVGRLRHAELPGEMSRLTALIEAALASELRPADSLTRESPGRYWLLAPDTDAGSARALVERLASAVRNAASHRGTPLEVAVGIAVCPVDGSRAEALAAHAVIALYAARASGRPVA